MNNKNNNISLFLKRKGWYALLLALSTIYVFMNIKNINNLSQLTAEKLIFYIWLILLLLPLFSEMEFMGFKLKKEMENVKKEVNEDIFQLRMQMLEFNVSNNLSAVVNFNALPASVEKLNNHANKIGILNISKKDQTHIKSYPDIPVPEQSEFLFRVHISIETLLKTLCKNTYYRGNYSVYDMLSHLASAKYIDSDTAVLISEIMKIALPGMHGDIPDDDYISFIAKVYPHIQSLLIDAAEKSAPKINDII